MRICSVLIAGFALFLSGCGNQGVLFAGSSPDDVARQLKKIDGVITVREGDLSPPELKVSRPDPATVLVAIAGRNGGEDTSIRFTLNAEGNDTRVTFETQVPHNETDIDGKRLVIEHDKVDKRFESALNSLAQAMRGDKRAPGAIRPLNYSVGLLAIASDPPESRRLMALASQAKTEASETDSAWTQDDANDDADADAAKDDAQGGDPAPDDDGGDTPDS